MKKLLALAMALTLCLGLAACGGTPAEDPADENTPQTETSGETVTLRVGATPAPHQEILEQVVDTLAAQGITLEIVPYTDYLTPNVAVEEGEDDANFFQHKPYLDEFAKARGLKLEVLASVHLEPMGVYSTKVKNVNDLKEGAKVAIPNDPTNGGRALKVLETAGLIKVKPEAGVLATVADVVDNPKKLQFAEIEAAQLPRALPDVDAAVINSNFALGANLNPTKDAIAVESKDSPYANIVVVREGDNREALQKLKAALTTPDVKKFLETQYKGAVLPAF